MMLVSHVRRLIRLLRGGLRALDVEIAIAHELSPEWKEALAMHARHLTAAGVRGTAVVMFLLVLLGWPTDLLVFTPGSPEMQAMFSWRVWLLADCAATFVALRGRWWAAHAFLVALVGFTVPVGVSGWLMGGIGAFHSPLSYGIYSVPLMTVLLVVDLPKRIFATALLVVAYFVCIFAADPSHLSHPIAGAPFIWSVAASITAVVVGHVVYALLTTNFLQRRRLDAQALELRARVSEQTAEIRHLAASISSIQERERSRIAQDLHDELGQLLVGLGMEIELLQRQTGMNDVTGGPIDGPWPTLREMINGTHDSLHRVIGALQPRALEEQGFDLAVTRMVHDLAKQHRFHAEVHIAVESDAFSPTASVILYRIIQEAVTNIARHAQAHHARLWLDSSDGDLVLRVSDDGVGFDPALLVNGNCLGLAGIRERSRLLRGTCTIASRPACGCEMVIRVPMHRLEEEAVR
jgi:signal transduction histidine kinase